MLVEIFSEKNLLFNFIQLFYCLFKSFDINVCSLYRWKM